MIKVERDKEADFLRRSKEHLWESIELLIALGKEAKAGQHSELLGSWSERLDEIAKEYRHTVCILEATHGDDLREERMKFDTKYFALRAFLSKHLRQNTQPVNPPTQYIRPSSHIRFPEINLPRFSGKQADWYVIRDAFDSAIGNRAEISNVDKFQYLKGLVQGEATRIIDSISVSEDGYRDAWRALKLRYENKRQLIRCHIKSLFAVPGMKKQSADELLNLVDKFEQQISVLKRLGEDTDSWDSLLIYQLSTRLDVHTLKEWESYCARLDSDNVANVLSGAAFCETDEDDMPTFVSMVNYSQNYARVLQCVSPFPGSSREYDPKVKLTKSAAHFSSSSSSPVAESTRKSQHFAKFCQSKPCNRCPKKHHTLLHGAQFIRQPVPGPQASNPSQPTPPPVVNTNASPVHKPYQPPSANSYANLHYAMMTCDKENVQTAVILPTALIEIEDARGHKVPARCLLDSGSQSHFITKALCEKLQLPRSSAPAPVLVCGIGQSTTTATHSVTAKVSSRVSPYVIESQLLVLPSLAIKLPGSSINIREWKIPETVRLADPTFHVSNEIDLILGAQYFFDTLRYGRIQLGEQLSVLQNSVFGWVVSGPCTIQDHDHADPRTCLMSSAARVEEMLRKFWELETVRDNKGWSATDKFCEEHFLANTTRTPEGKYIVRLPKREELVPQLDVNMYQATRRFYSLERSLMSDPQKRKLYQNFVAQYIAMGHMREVTEEELNVRPQFILPHHGVLKPESTTTKLRIVFDASCKSRSCLSLNDVMIPGPTIQEMLVEIRDDPELRLKVYQLVTITYGLNNSPFLATRVLKQLATEEKSRYPHAAEYLLKDFYVDNLLTGSNDVKQLKLIVKEMIELLNAGGFPLRQWSSNCQDILDVVPEQLRETRMLLDLDRETSVAALGLRWEPATDQLLFKSPKWKNRLPITKRTVLSQMSSLFDPLGLLGPTVVRAKIIIQALWKCQLEWDTPLPVHFEEEWTLYQQDICHLKELRIPRLVMLSPHRRLEIHGFSDASLQAYGACLYIRSIDANGHCYVQLLTAKSRVAPLSSKSISRLELSAALLLAHLLAQVQKCTSLEAPIYLWTDSNITLDWISALPSTWKTFVSNRVAEIQEITSTAIWNHVPSNDNPADLLSRGTSLENLVKNALWWNGPVWIRSSSESWPPKYVSRKQDPNDPEFRKVVALPVFTEPKDIIDRYSSLTSLIRVCVWWHRFRYNTRRTKGERVIGPLSVSEIDRALFGLISRVQEDSFGPELKQLTRNEAVSKKSKLRFLNPQLDDGLIRVGGRLHHSSLAVDKRHPVVLPANHKLTRMIASLEHLKTLHGGPNLLLSSLRRRFWPLNGRNLASSTVHRCVTCARASPKSLEQLMGDLPPVRVTRAFPFENVGVDFAGPIFLRAPNKRAAPVNAYVAVYVCLAVKAVHLDLVPDLTSEAFIASLHRFSGRRGKPSNIYCDNGRNFVGAQRELAELRTLFISQQDKNIIAQECAASNIAFHFIPPGSPSLGGIWEAAVKSMKFHLRRIMTNAMLTETEFRTALIQIEATLNSRPITDISWLEDRSTLFQNPAWRTFQKTDCLAGNVSSVYRSSFGNVGRKITSALFTTVIAGRTVRPTLSVVPSFCYEMKTCRHRSGPSEELLTSILEPMDSSVLLRLGPVTKRAVSKLYMLPVEVGPESVQQPSSSADDSNPDEE
ncbi:uncharacterized protein LOC129773872 [Toxorhynchites rutilus septentrionalis]|uniref:uncharacterized protein LOC129773872 n=1 Tax=Toxorhynchites rutilus septentrionalis TaxID=329112 RepID=UPI00247A0B72|nr:uncharacterized protein LOC129773872 [Toxorhynchites rutilus septentrionalis]